MAAQQRPTTRIILIGDSNAGKSSLMNALCRDVHQDTYPTIGFDFNGCDIDGNNVNFWDTAGMERFRSITPMYFRNIDACWVVVDASDRNRDSQATYWLAFARKHTTVPILLVLTKTDLLRNEDAHPKFDFSAHGVPCVEGNCFESQTEWIEKVRAFVPTPKPKDSDVRLSGSVTPRQCCNY